MLCYYYWSKKNSSLDRGQLRYRGSTVINFHISSIFVGIRIFQHLNLLLVHFDPISLMRSQPAQNAYLTKLHLVLDFRIFKLARLCIRCICNDAE